MTFKAYIHQIIKVESSYTDIISYIGFFLLVVGLVFYWIYKNVFHVVDGYAVLFFISFIGLLAIFAAHIYQYYDFEKIKNFQNGVLELGKEELIINYDEKIRYEDLTDFELSIDAYFDESINRSSRGPIEKRSLGIRNTLSVTHQSNTRKFNFKIENSSHLKVLERNLYQLVVSGKLKNIDAKKSIKLVPECYKTYEEYRAYIGKQLKANKISCTEGLLLIGYKNYEEAQELKRKYCS